MYFTREALEVASGERVSKYRTARYRPYTMVGDFGCGIGADTIGLSAERLRVSAVERDDLRLQMAEANLLANDCLSFVNFHSADLLVDPLPDVPAAFADPGRRTGGKRFLSLADYLPPPGELLRRLPAGFPIAFKLAPGVNRAEVESFDGEVEFISVNGELKECVLWLGPLQTERRRATLIQDQGTYSLTHPSGQGWSEPRAISAFLYDPDPAVTRAELVSSLSDQYGWERVDAVVQLLTADFYTPTPFATAYRVDTVLPFDVRTVQSELKKRCIGRVTVVNRGSLADVELASKKWKLTGTDHRFVILTRQLGKQVAVVAERYNPALQM